MREFVALLKVEQTTLIDGNADALSALIDKKSALATRLTAQAQGRETALASARLPTGREGMEAWLAASPHDTTSRRNWQELLPLAGEARRLNELNGKLIGTRMQHTQQALAALMGATQHAMTYGPDGHTQTKGPGGRMLGSA